MPTSSPSSSSEKYLAGLFVGILAVSTASIFIRFAQREIPSLVIAAGRLTLASLFLLPFAIHQIKKQTITISRKTWFLLCLSGLFLGLHFVTWITSLEYTSVASSVVLVTTAPLWVALFSPLFLQENLSSKVVIGLLVAFSGSVVVGLSSNCSLTSSGVMCSGFESMWSGNNFFGNLLALAGAFLSAGYLMAGRSVRDFLPLSVYTTVVYGIGSFVILLLILFTGTKVAGYSAQGYLWIIALALIPQLVGHTLFNWALKYLAASYVSIALLGEPVGTIFLAAILLKEKPALLELMGGILILVGITIATQLAVNKKTSDD
jgi:drug/metabolite transporter (DMT)-like permease